jgi:seryl-tRNA synthetase
MLNMSTEELGASAFQKFDIEAWMPGRGSWGELASASNCTSYQARRLNIRHTLPTVAEVVNSGQAVTAKSNKTAYCHTLNATAVAIPRLIVALVENGARFDENGKWTSLELPKALRQYWLGKESLSDTSQVALNANKGSPKSIDIVWV